jgi:hypothetical protein
MITRKDLEPGYQGTMAIHAAIQFGMEHPITNKNWYEKSNYVGFLSVSNEEELLFLSRKAMMLEIECSIYREPDINNEIAAIALAPGKRSKKLCSNLKLALKELSQEEHKMTLTK